MTLNEITMQTEEPLHTVRQCYERAHLMVSDLLDEYFSVDNGVDISDQKEWWKLAHGFKNAETRSEIILDALARMRDALTEVEAVMEQIGSRIGIAFQIQDDILDVIGDSEELGKAVGSDEKNHKTTYVTLEGLEKAGEKVKILTEEAIDLLAKLPGEQEFFRELLCSLCTRRK